MYELPRGLLLRGWRWRSGAVSGQLLLPLGRGVYVPMPRGFLLRGWRWCSGAVPDQLLLPRGH